MDAKILKKKVFFDHQKLKKHPKKLHTYGSWEFFFLCSPDALNSPELHFRFINSFIQSSLLRSLRFYLLQRRQFQLESSSNFPRHQRSYGTGYIHLEYGIMGSQVYEKGIQNYTRFFNNPLFET